MIKKNGIARKTFVFTAVLITLVVTASFGILYLVLPDYYFYAKNNRLQRNANILTQSLKASTTESQCITLISDFMIINNANVLSFDSQGEFLPNLSAPFVLMDDRQRSLFTIISNDAVALEENLTETERNIQFSVAGLENESDYLTSKERGQKIYITGADTANYRIRFTNIDMALTSTIKDVQNNFIDSITINSTLQPIDEAKTVILELIPYLLFIDFIIALVASYIYSKQFTKPILKISNAAAQMQQMTPETISNVRTNDELGQLSQNLDSLYMNLCANIQDLKYEMDKVNQLEQSKTDFMRAAGHELKTPIAALNGIIEGMIDNIGVYKNKEKYLGESKKLVNKLSVLVNSILNASNLENLDERIVYEKVNIKNLVKSQLIDYQLFIDEKELHVIESFEKNAGFIFNTDKRMLSIALSNLISNAVNYTDKGGKINISFTQQENNRILSIENQCTPVEDEKLQKLFEPFYTLNYSRDKTKSGTGLGLHIVKNNLETLNIPYEVLNTQLGLKFNIFFADPFI